MLLMCRLSLHLFSLISILLISLHRYSSFARYPLQYLKDCTSNFRSNFGKGVYKAAFSAIDKTNPKLLFFVKRSTAIKLTDDSLNLQDEVSVSMHKKKDVY